MQSVGTALSNGVRAGAGPPPTLQRGVPTSCAGLRRKRSGVYCLVAGKQNENPDMFERSQHVTSREEQDVANPFVHVELNTSDPEKAKAFYSKLFDWQLEDVPNPAVPTGS